MAFWCFLVLQTMENAPMLFIFAVSNLLCFCFSLQNWQSRRIFLNPLSANIKKWSNTLKQFIGKLPTNCLSMFDHFMGLALKGLKTDIATGCTYFKPQYYTRKSSFYLFSMIENPVKPRITQSRKNLDKQDKIDLGKTLSYGLQNR